MEQVNPSHLCSQIDETLETLNLAEENIWKNSMNEEKSLEEKSESLTKHIAQLKDIKDNLRRDKERKDITVKELEKKELDLKEEEIAPKAAEKEIILKENADLETKMMEKRRLLEQQKKDNIMRKSSAKENKERYTAELSACINQLQLDIYPEKENYIKFVFKCISTTNPEELYYFVLYLGESGKYKVTECQPELSDLESLLNILNTDRELYSFVKRMRNSFVAID